MDNSKIKWCFSLKKGLEKIEELTLYTVEQQRQIEMLNQRLQTLEIQN